MPAARTVLELHLETEPLADLGRALAGPPQRRGIQRSDAAQCREPVGHGMTLRHAGLGEFEIGVPGDPAGDRVLGNCVTHQDEPGRRCLGQDPGTVVVCWLNKFQLSRLGRPLPRHRLLACSGIHRLVSKPVGMAVLQPRNPAEANPVEPAGELGGAAGQRSHRRVLDLPAPGHLLHYELGIHPYRDLNRAEIGGGLQSSDQAPVLGDVVRLDADGFLALSQHRAGIGVENHRAVAGRPGIAAGAAVRLDDHPKRASSASHSPDSWVRTRIRRQFSQRST